MDRFRNEDKADYLNLCREFEVKKRGIRPDSTVKITNLNLNYNNVFKNNIGQKFFIYILQYAIYTN
jgi:hypothetical protein